MVSVRDSVGFAARARTLRVHPWRVRRGAANQTPPTRHAHSPACRNPNGSLTGSAGVWAGRRRWASSPSTAATSSRTRRALFLRWPRRAARAARTEGPHVGPQCVRRRERTERALRASSKMSDAPPSPCPVSPVQKRRMAPPLAIAPLSIVPGRYPRHKPDMCFQGLSKKV